MKWNLKYRCESSKVHACFWDNDFSLLDSPGKASERHKGLATTCASRRSSGRRIKIHRSRPLFTSVGGPLRYGRKRLALLEVIPSSRDKIIPQSYSNSRRVICSAPCATLASYPPRNGRLTVYTTAPISSEHTILASFKSSKLLK